MAMENLDKDEVDKVHILPRVQILPRLFPPLDFLIYD
jgi:hypothetical protein